MEHAKRLKLANFKYYMRDDLSKTKSTSRVCEVINLNTSNQNDSHHLFHWINGKDKYYFYSFDVIPPEELISYLKSPILYSTYQTQQFNDTNCSEWCFFVSNKLNQGEDFINFFLNILNEYKL